MGLEASCMARVGERVVQVKALLESDELIVRGEHRARLSFASLDSVEVSAGRLTIRHGGETLMLELGPAAERWAEKIRNPRTLLDKLGVKAGQRAAIVGLTDPDLSGKLRERIGVTEAAPDSDLGRPPDLDLVFFQVASPADLARLPRLAEAIVPDGAIWVVHPKGRADLKDVDVIAAGRAAGLVDNKVARVSETLSALRFVTPKARRPAARATARATARGARR